MGLASVAALAAPLTLAACGADDAPPVALSADGTRGQERARAIGCTNCHSADGSKRQGPTFRGQWGKVVTLSGGRTATYDEAYVTESVRNPNAARRPGFTGAMTPYDQAKVSDADLALLMAYVRDLGAG